MDQEEEDLMKTKLKEEEYCVFGSDLESTVKQVKKYKRSKLIDNVKFYDPDKVPFENIYSVKDFTSKFPYDDFRDKIWITLKSIIKNKTKLSTKLQSSPADFMLTLRIFLSSQTDIFDHEIKIICEALRAKLKHISSKMSDLTSTIIDIESQIDKFETYPELFCEK